MEAPGWPYRGGELAIDDYVARMMLCDEVAEARELMQEMKQKDLPLAMKVWHGALGVSANATDWQEAKKLLEEMEAEGLTPDHAAYHLAMDAGEGSGGKTTWWSGFILGAPIDHAESLFEEMKKRAMLPTQETYTKVLHSFILQENEKRARQVYRKAFREGMLNCYSNRGVNLAIYDYPIDVATFILRVAVIDRAGELVGRKAGKTTMHVLTRKPGVPKYQDAQLETMALSILRDEFGLKAKLEPSDFGRIRLRGSELERFGRERRGLPVRQKVGR
ncbi:unnamed protein product [Effrenium voratum]|nr:unnamed protein product [Effrenium voratum]